MNLKPKFRAWSKQHPNMMTPTIVKLIEIKPTIIIEISRGFKMDSFGDGNTSMYGVSVFSLVECGSCHQVIFKPFGEFRLSNYNKLFNEDSGDLNYEKALHHAKCIKLDVLNQVKIQRD